MDTKVVLFVYVHVLVCVCVTSFVNVCRAVMHLHLSDHQVAFKKQFTNCRAACSKTFIYHTIDVYQP